MELERYAQASIRFENASAHSGLESLDASMITKPGQPLIMPLSL
jgi:hypothetical protein